jgi:FeS assembly protein IscX
VPKPTLHWLEVDEIATRLFAAHPTRDPLTIRFTELRRLAEALPGFTPDPDHPVNEKILETIQMRWHEEFTDAPREEE